jgi:hypothetical protein
MQGSDFVQSLTFNARQQYLRHYTHGWCVPLSVCLCLLLCWELISIKDHNRDDTMIQQHSDPCHAELNIPEETIDAV